MGKLVLASILVVVSINIVATVFLFKSQLQTNFQKIFQFLFIWMLPLIGSAIVLYLLKPRKQDFIDLSAIHDQNQKSAVKYGRGS